MKRHHPYLTLGFLISRTLIFCLALFLTACGGGGCDSGASGTGDNSTTDNGGITTGDYVVLAWNDLGMHCLNPTYDRLVILPPYNTLWAQVIERGAPPRVVTDGIQVQYAIQDNTTSLNKLFYDQFWEPGVLALFGAAGLAPDTGLNLHDPDIHNGLSGTMQQVGDHFQADGIPVTPVRDGTTTKDPYQIARITVTDPGGATLAQTRAMVPTSDEINCGKCHEGNTTTAVFNDILAAHDEEEGTTLMITAPVLCASCHGSPALGSAAGDRGSSHLYLSEAIHGFHANQIGVACYDCHPGNQTQCSRSLAHTRSDGNCVACHGTMSAMAAAITNNTKVPWINEPGCADCHDPASVQGVDTGATLYRNAAGHGGLYCAACHQSPHAMVPSREGTDNYQALQYQSSAVTIGSCAACHTSSRGADEDFDEFRETHTGSNAEASSACNVCHTALPASVTAAQFPHQFTWHAR